MPVDASLAGRAFMHGTAHSSDQHGGRRALWMPLLDRGRRLLLGLDDPEVELGQVKLEQVKLEHGDRLLCFTDGFTEARGRDGAPFGEDRLVDLAERHAAAELSAPETLRRLAHAVAEHLDGPPGDDATVLLIEWGREAAERILP